MKGIAVFLDKGKLEEKEKQEVPLGGRMEAVSLSFDWLTAVGCRYLKMQTDRPSCYGCQDLECSDGWVPSSLHDNFGSLHTKHDACFSCLTFPLNSCVLLVEKLRSNVPVERSVRRKDLCVREGSLILRTSAFWSLYSFLLLCNICKRRSAL